MTDYEERIRRPLQVLPPLIRADLSLTPAISQCLELQVAQMQQQREIINAMFYVTQNRTGPRSEGMKSDLFDGQSQSPTTWVDFYEYAATGNEWTEDVDWIRNLRPFLTGMSIKWNNLRILHCANDS